MIAVAGSKGGCGKSTVTLGLAEAFARVGTPALAIDADRQLPNLHVMADVDREPTVAALEGGVDLRELAHQHPREPNVGILPAPRSPQAFEYESLAERVELDGVRTLLDCPSGAGPDVTDPLRQAEGVVVVSSDGDRSLEAAELTIEMAHRLGVPVYGAILNRCEAVPERVASWEGVPVLGTIPDRPSPLLNEDVTTAFDEIAAQFDDRAPRQPGPIPPTGGRLPLGTPAVDRALEGGLPSGSLVALVAEPASQVEHLLYRATAVRGTLYLSTERSRANVREAIDEAPVDAGTPTVRHVSGQDALSEASDLIEKLPEGATLVVDPVDPLEARDRRRYAAFVDDLKARIVETDGVAVLHCSSETANRAVTKRAADAVLSLETVSPGVDRDVEHYVSIPKCRHDASLSATVPLGFTEADPLPTEATARSD